MSKRWKQEEIAQLIQLAEAGYTRSRAAEKMGRPVCKYFLATHGIRFSGVGGTCRRFDWTTAKNMAAKGYWCSKAARKLGVHHTTLLYLAKRTGFTWPKPPMSVYCDPPRGIIVKQAPPEPVEFIVIPHDAPLDTRSERMLQLMAIIAKKAPASVAAREMGVRHGS